MYGEFDNLTDFGKNQIFFQKTQHSWEKQKKHLQGCQNCTIRVQSNIWKKNSFFEKKNFSCQNRTVRQTVLVSLAKYFWQGQKNCNLCVGHLVKKTYEIKIFFSFLVFDGKFIGLSAKKFGRVVKTACYESKRTIKLISYFEKFLFWSVFDSERSSSSLSAKNSWHACHNCI